jgi:hypothetical protein
MELFIEIGASNENEKWKIITLIIIIILWSLGMQQKKLAHCTNSRSLFFFEITLYVYNWILYVIINI